MSTFNFSMLYTMIPNDKNICMLQIIQFLTIESPLKMMKNAFENLCLRQDSK